MSPTAKPLGRASTATVSAAVQSPSAPGTQTGLTLANGARVLDRLEGEYGTVKSGTAAHLVNAIGGTARRETYTVALDNGQTVSRERYQLAALAPAAAAPASSAAAPSAPGAPIPAGKNALAVIAAEKSAGFETVAQQLASGNPGIPAPGTLEYASWVKAGWI